MANVKISELTAATTLAATDQFEINAGGTSKSATAQKVLDLAASATQTLSNKTISGSSNTITNVSLTSGVTGTLPIANGGSGQTTATAAFNALAPSQSSNSGKYLTTDGTNTSWGSINAGGLTLLSTLTASDSATLSDTTNITSAYDAYWILFENIRHNNVDAKTLYIEPTTDAGSSWVSTGAPTVTAVTGNTDIGLTGAVFFSNPNSSVKKQFVGHLCVDSSTTLKTVVGTPDATSAINGIRFYFATSQNITAGKIRIYGVKTS